MPPRPALSFAIPVALFAATLLAGCDMLGIESPEKVAAVRDADGRAIGGACRHAARAIEDCYLLNKKADKAAVFAGWRDMNDYMRENKIEPVAPTLAGQPAKVGTAKADDAAAEDATTKKAPGKATDNSTTGGAKPQES